MWPKRLTRLTFGFFFNQSIEIAADNWPPSLLHVSLGDCYNLPIGDVPWPRSLAEVSVAMPFSVRVHGGSVSIIVTNPFEGGRRSRSKKKHFNIC